MNYKPNITIKNVSLAPELLVMKVYLVARETVVTMDMDNVTCPNLHITDSFIPIINTEML